MNQFKSAWQFAYNHWQFLAVMAFPVFLVEVITAYYLTDAALLMEAGNIDDITMYFEACLLYTSPSPRDLSTSRMPSSA